VGRQTDYWSLTDGELEQLAAKINVPPASKTPSGDWYIDRDRIIDALLKRDKALQESEPQQPASHRGLAVFISHSSRDADLALALIDLLKAGLALTADQIRCSSVDGYRLPVGVNTEGKLREEVNAAKVVIGLITPNSLASYYVMFELGARWGANLFLAPLLAGVKGSELSGPLSLLNALSGNSDAQLHQLLGDIAKHLGLPLQPAPSYIRNVTAVKALADTIANPTTPKPLSVESQQKVKIKMSVDGIPPSQALKITADRTITVLRLEYLFANGQCAIGEDLSVEGQNFELPINDEYVTHLWNEPRSDASFDNSGPAGIGVLLSTEDETEHYVLPVHMGLKEQNGERHVMLVGSKKF
jgi:hypothetical protein